MPRLFVRRNRFVSMHRRPFHIAVFFATVVLVCILLAILLHQFPSPSGRIMVIGERSSPTSQLEV
jgi:hypothetical protein